jgi:hypothetical protein
MDSSRVAFEKFDIWKKSNTVLRVSVWTNGGLPDIWTGSISSADESKGKVALVREGWPHLIEVFNVEGAEFEVEDRSVEVFLEGDRFRFEVVVPN